MLFVVKSAVPVRSQGATIPTFIDKLPWPGPWKLVPWGARVLWRVTIGETQADTIDAFAQFGFSADERRIQEIKRRYQAELQAQGLIDATTGQFNSFVLPVWNNDP